MMGGEALSKLRGEAGKKYVGAQATAHARATQRARRGTKRPSGKT